jgi:hypothetical protein
MFSRDNAFYQSAILAGVSGMCGLLSGTIYKITDRFGSELNDWGDFSIQASQCIFGALFLIAGGLAGVRFVSGSYYAGQSCLSIFRPSRDATNIEEVDLDQDVKNPFSSMARNL